MAFPISIVFIALLALIQAPMTVVVGLYRSKTGILFMDGSDEAMMRRMRAHGNFTETVPITLLAMAAAEYAGAPAALLWAGGLVLLAGRIMHYAAIRQYGGAIGRAIGMTLTLIAMAGFGLYGLLAFTGILT